MMSKTFVNHLWIGGDLFLKVGRKIRSQRQIFFHCVVLHSLFVQQEKKLLYNSIILSAGKKIVEIILLFNVQSTTSITADGSIDPISHVPVFLFRYLKETRQILLCISAKFFPKITNWFIFIYTKIMFQLPPFRRNWNLNCKRCNRDLITKPYRSRYMHRSMFEHL